MASLLRIVNYSDTILCSGFRHGESAELGGVTPRRCDFRHGESAWADLSAENPGEAHGSPGRDTGATAEV